MTGWGSDQDLAGRERSDFAWIAGLVLIALLVRLGYFSFTHHIYGDAVQFSAIARQILAGKGSEVDTSWFQCFCFWQVPFQYLVPDRTWAAGLSSMIPGALLVVPVFAMTRVLYSRTAAILASLFGIFHPNLVNYSCNGYMESFYILCFAVAVWMMIRLFRKPGVLPAITAGMVSALAFATRNEYIAFFAVACVLVLATTLPPIRRRLRHEDTETLAFLELPFRKVAGYVIAMMLAFGALTGGYTAVTKATIGSNGIFEKSGNFSRRYDIFNQREQSAKEIYGKDTPSRNTEPDDSPGLGGLIRQLTLRFANNVRVSFVDSFARLLACPLYLFAAVPFFAWFRQRRLRLEVIPVIMMLAFTPMLYSLIFVQPRYLQPMLPPLHVFSAAGLMLAAEWSVARNSRLKRIGPAVAGALIILLVAVTSWRATRVRARAVIHEQMGSWIAMHVPEDALLVGCGFGQISETAFLTGNPSRPRIVTDDASELAPFVRNHGTRWLLLYEQFIKEANPGLAPLLESGVPGFVRVFEATDSRGLRAQVHELKPVR